MNSPTPTPSSEEEETPNENNASTTQNETLALKKKKLDGLATIINLLPTALTWKQKEQVDALEYGLSDRLAKLRQEFQLKEADIKIAQMEKLLLLLKKEN